VLESTDGKLVYDGTQGIYTEIFFVARVVVYFLESFMEEVIVE
jgi:hypothetical protein